MNPAQASTFNPSIKTLLLSIAIIGSISFVWSVFNQFIAHRHLFLLAWLVATVATIALAFTKHAELARIPDPNDRKRETARTKLYAEIAAAGALLAFVGPFFNTGVQLDQNFQVQFRRLAEIDSVSRYFLTKEYCGKTVIRQMRCNEVNAGIQSLIAPLGKSQTDEVEMIILGMEDALKGLDFPHDSLAALEIEDALSALRDLSAPSAVATKLIDVLRLFSMLFAAFAIAWKIAIARLDYCPPKAVPQTQAEHDTRSPVTLASAPPAADQG